MMRWPGNGFAWKEDVLFDLLMLPPVWKGFLALLFAGSAFPLAGVMVTRLDMLPLRYMLMHALMLGGAIALAWQLPTLFCYAAVSLLVVVCMLYVGKDKRVHLGLSSAVLMVLSMALASLLMQVKDVPAKDTLELLWGSPFTISVAELVAFGLLSVVLFLFVFLSQREISIVFFDGDVAKTLLPHASAYRNAMVFLIALVVALSMRFVGALLIDALLLLPVLTAMRWTQSLKGLFISSSVVGFLVAFLGYLVALLCDFPPGASVALVSCIVYGLSALRRK